MLIDGKSKSKKKRKRKNEDEREIDKMIEGRRQDENYIYLDLETPEDHNEAINNSNDKMWEPGTSDKKIKPNKVKKTPSISSSSSSHQPSTSNKSPNMSEKEKQTAAPIDPTSDQSEKAKKHKKGLATPKQRLAKKLWQRR